MGVPGNYSTNNPVKSKVSNHCHLLSPYFCLVNICFFFKYLQIIIIFCVCNDQGIQYKMFFSPIPSLFLRPITGVNSP